MELLLSKQPRQERTPVDHSHADALVSLEILDHPHLHRTEDYEDLSSQAPHGSPLSHILSRLHRVTSIERIQGVDVLQSTRKATNLS